LGHLYDTRSLPHQSFGAITLGRVSKAFACHKGDAAQKTAFFVCSVYQSYKAVRRDLLRRLKQRGYLIAGFDGIFHIASAPLSKNSDAELLASLCSSRRKHGTTALGSHA
jgi:hypothetical protein